jgi:predicted AlkP superfamily pyrophosphatase or phosphodiesterase
MQKTVVLNVVGLTSSLLGEYTPFLASWAKKGQLVPIEPVLPAVTCSAQASYLTGVMPDKHGIVGNGWYFRDECEVKFWRQSNKLIQAPKIWETAYSLDSNFTCANLFWWYNMYSSVDWTVTPRPMYPADGRKFPDIYTQPAEMRSQLQAQLGQFPLFKFWGPNTSIESSQWIAESAMWTEHQYSPTLTLVYLPHLDYCLQKFGPDLAKIQDDLKQIDRLCADLINFYQAHDAEVIILSEYGITAVNQPIHLNRVLRQNGLIAVREELGRELLDPGASIAFAVADHQVAHVYINDANYLNEVRSILEAIPGIAQILDESTKPLYHLDHDRSGELIAISEPHAWFTYYYWLNDHQAPDFATTVDIHRKPGYDPVELFFAPEIKLPQVKVGLTLLKKKLGFRYLMNCISLDAELVKGSHGCIPISVAESPVLISNQKNLVERESIKAIDVKSIILDCLFASN